MAKKKTHEEFEREIEEVGKGEYKLISTYQGVRHKILIKHKIEGCGHVYQIRPADFKRGRRCKQCSGLMRKTTQQFKKEIEMLVDDEYVLVSPYEKSQAHVKMRHNHKSCGYEYQVRPCDFLRGRRCPKCKSSRGEAMIEMILRELKLSFDRQVVFSDCKHIKSLRYDFGVMDGNGEIVFLIEYDGRQHFQAVEHFGGIQTFLERLRNDRIKSNYAKMMGLPLLRVRYDEKQAEHLVRHAIRNHFNKTDNPYIAI